MGGSPSLAALPHNSFTKHISKWQGEPIDLTADLDDEHDVKSVITTPAMAPRLSPPFAHRDHPFRSASQSPVKAGATQTAGPANVRPDYSAPSTAGAMRAPSHPTATTYARSGSVPGSSSMNGVSDPRYPAHAPSNTAYGVPRSSSAAANGAHRGGYASSVSHLVVESNQHQGQPYKKRKLDSWSGSPASSVHPFSSSRLSADPPSVRDYSSGPSSEYSDTHRRESSYTPVAAQPYVAANADLAVSVTASRNPSISSSSLFAIPNVYVPELHSVACRRDSNSASPLKTTKRYWTESEMQDLLKGVHWFGEDWEKILHCPRLSFLRRSADELEDRYRLLQAGVEGDVSARARGKRPADDGRRHERAQRDGERKGERARNRRPEDGAREMDWLGKERGNTVGDAIGLSEEAKGKRPVDDGTRPEREARVGERQTDRGTAMASRPEATPEYKPWGARDRRYVVGDNPTRNRLNEILSSHRPDTTPSFRPAVPEGRALLFGRPAHEEEVVVADFAKAVRREETPRTESRDRSASANVGSTEEKLRGGSGRNSQGFGDVTTNTEAILNAYKAARNGLELPVVAAQSPVTQDDSPIQSANGPGNAGPDDDTHAPAVGDGDADDLPTALPSPYQPPAHPAPKMRINQLSSGRLFTEEEDHLMIFLREVKGLSYSKVFETYNQVFPGRTQGSMTTHYCSKLRDRKNRDSNPPVLRLPSSFSTDPGAAARGSFYEYDPLPAAGPTVLSGSEVAPRPRGRPRKDASSVAALFSDPPQPWLDARFSGQDRSSVAAEERGERRLRRNVPAVNYTIPGLRIRSSPSAEQAEPEDEVDSIMGGIEEDTPTAPLEQRTPTEAISLPYEKPLELCADQDVGLLITSEKLPYLSFSQRKMVQAGSENMDWDPVHSNKWKGSVMHVDFTDFELATVENVMEKLWGKLHESRSLRKRFKKTLQAQSEPKLLLLSRELRKTLQRDQASVEAFIEDAKEGCLSRQPHVERLATTRPRQKYSSKQGAFSTTVLLRQRELGLQTRRGWKTASTSVTYQTRNGILDTLGPAYGWSGASSDVHALAWSPDGQSFIAGACSITDVESYNRPNNLICGDVQNGTVRELREHCEETGNSLDSPKRKVFSTVTAVAYSEDGTLMFSASYDNTVAVWSNYRNGQHLAQPTCLIRLSNSARIDLMSVYSHRDAELVATAARRSKNAVKICKISKDEELGSVCTDLEKFRFSSATAVNYPDMKILPQALKFEPRYGQRLLAGFGANRTERDESGDICLWDVETQTPFEIRGSSRNVFDVAWMPERNDTFAVGCVASGKVNRGTRSVIRLYSYKEQNKGFSLHYGLELDCRALDMNDVVFW